MNGIHSSKEIHKKSKIPYCDNILEIQILPAAQRLYGRNWRLQQDNDSKHTSRVAKTFIDEKRIHVMDWPLILTPLLKMCVMKNNVEKQMPMN